MKTHINCSGTVWSSIGFLIHFKRWLFSASKKKLEEKIEELQVLSAELIKERGKVSGLVGEVYLLRRLIEDSEAYNLSLLIRGLDNASPVIISIERVPQNNLEYGAMYFTLFIPSICDDEVGRIYLLYTARSQEVIGTGSVKRDYFDAGIEDILFREVVRVIGDLRGGKYSIKITFDSYDPARVFAHQYGNELRSGVLIDSKLEI